MQAVFRDQYHFDVRKKLLHTQSDPQSQAFRHLSEFVDDENRPNRLLIVYYAGHGFSRAADTREGRISLSGRYLVNDREIEEESIEWIEVERVLSRTKADVLVIFDCCNAGRLCRQASRGQDRCFQYLGACEAKHRTRRAGPQSFTHAMIWALGQLAKEPGFPVTKLVQVIQCYEHFPKDQFPVLFGGRFEPASNNIYIAPMIAPTSSDLQAPPSPPTSVLPSPQMLPADVPKTHDVLDLRFHFAQKATEQDIINVAKAMRHLVNQPTPTCHRVSFVDHYSFVERATQRWRRYRRNPGPEVTTPVSPGVQLHSSSAAVKEMDRRLLQLPRINTTNDGAEIEEHQVLSGDGQEVDAVVAFIAEAPIPMNDTPDELVRVSSEDDDTMTAHPMRSSAMLARANREDSEDVTIARSPLQWLAHNPAVRRDQSSSEEHVSVSAGSRTADGSRSAYTHLHLPFAILFLPRRPHSSWHSTAYM